MASEKYITDKPVLYKSGQKKNFTQKFLHSHVNLIQNNIQKLHKYKPCLCNKYAEQ